MNIHPPAPFKGGELVTGRSERITGALMFAGCYLYFWYVIPYHVIFKEQIQLFVFQSSYLLIYFSKPASLACLIGDFLTQFFYFKSGGAVVITFLLFIEWWLIRLSLKLIVLGKVICDTSRFSAELCSIVALLPVMAEWIAFPRLSFSVSLSVSLILSLSVFFIHTKINRKKSFFTAIILIPVLYFVVGVSVFLFVFLAVLYHRKIGKAVVLLALSIAVPFFFRYYFLLTSKQAFLFPFPDILHGLSLVIMAFAALLLVCFRGFIGGRQGGIGIIGELVLRVLLVIILAFILFKTVDRKQEALFGMITEAYYKRWDKIVDIAEKEELKTPVATHYINLALSHQNLLGERLMDFYQPFSSGLLLSVAPTADWLSIFSSSDGYFHIGDMEMAQHAALIGMLFSPYQRSARLVERLVEINLAIDDQQVAAKYKRMLDATLFHRVKEGRTHGLETDSFFYEVKKNRASGGFFSEDVLRNATDNKGTLELLAVSYPDNQPAINYLLCFYLLNKDIPAFFKVYTTYCKGKVFPVPKVYAEALLIYFAVAQLSGKEMLDYGISIDVIQQFGDYTRLYETAKGQLLPVQKQYPNTYWLYYHFAVMNKE